MTALCKEGICSGSLTKRDMSFPHVTDLTGQRTRTSIRAPVNAGNLNVLEKDEVQWELPDGKYQDRRFVRDEDLLDFTARKAHNNCPPLPSNALERICQQGMVSLRLRGSKQRTDGP